MQSLRMYVLCAAAILLSAAIGWAEPPADIYEPKTAFAETDVNSDGRVDVGEFHDRLLEVFYSADTNKDGYLDADELARLPFRESLVIVDRSGDGKITLQEFVRIRLHQFIEVDANDDGELSLQEVIDAYEGRPAQ